MAESDAHFLQPVIAYPDDIEGPSASRKDPAAALNHQRQMPTLEKIGQFRGEKLLKTLTEKLAVFSEMTKKIGGFGAVAKVAATFAADADLPAGALHFLKEYDFPASFGGSTRRHHACGTAADDDGCSDFHGVWFPC
jgi:hypothetical protein